MATLAIPVIAGVAGLVAQFAPPLIAGVESLFGKGTGKTKLDTVANAIANIAAKLSGAGVLQQPAPAPNDPALLSAIEAILAQMKITGQLPAAGSGTPAPVVGSATAASGSALRAALLTARGVLDSLLTITQ